MAAAQAFALALPLLAVILLFCAFARESFFAGAAVEVRKVAKTCRLSSLVS